MDAGKARIPAGLHDDQAYMYINVLNTYLQFIHDAQAWANAHHATVVDFTLSADSSKWSGLKKRDAVASVLVGIPAGADPEPTWRTGQPPGGGRSRSARAQP